MSPPDEPRTLWEFLEQRHEARRQTCRRLSKTSSTVYSPFRQFFIDIIVYRCVSVIVLDCGFDMQTLSAVSEIPCGDGTYIRGSTADVLRWLDQNKSGWDRAKYQMKACRAAANYVARLPGPLSPEQEALQNIANIALNGDLVDQMAEETTDPQREKYTKGQLHAVQLNRPQFAKLMEDAGMKKVENPT